MSSEACGSPTDVETGVKTRDEEMEELRKFKKKKSLEEETAKKSEEERLDKNRVKQKKYELSIIYTMICL